MSQLLLHLLGLCDELRVDVWSMTRAIRNLSTIMLGAHIMHIRLISMTFSANMAMDQWNTRIHYLCTLKKLQLHVPFKKPWCFPTFVTLVFNLGHFLDGSSGCDHVGNDCASMYSHRAMESAATETAWAGAAESQESATTCMACQSGGEICGNDRQCFFLGWWLWGWEIISRWCQMGNSITEICKISWCFWMAGQPTPP